MSSVHIFGNPVDVVESYAYLGSEIHSTGSSFPEVRRLIGLTKSCFNLLNRGIWHSSISLCTKVQLCHTYSQPVLLYGSETWALTQALQDKVDAFDQVRRLQFFGHAARMYVSIDITRALKVSIRGLIKDWRRPPGRPNHTWLRTLEADFQPLNLGLNSARKYTQDREHWKHLVETAKHHLGGCT